MLKAFGQPFHRLRVPAPDSFKGQTVLVTGSNTGVGLESARHVLRMGAAKIILGVRTLVKGKAAKEDLTASTGTRPESIEVWQVDLESFESVKSFATRMKRYIEDEDGQLDTAILNAGMASGQWNLTSDGWERTLEVNGLSTALLSLRLLPLLVTQSKKSGKTPHLVIVASDMHMYVKFPEKHADNILQNLNDKAQWEKSQALGGPAERYGLTKLLDIFVTIELAKMMSEDHQGNPPVIVNCVTPGFCKSELLTREPAPLILKLLQWATARDVKDGSKALVDAAVRGVETHGQWLENQHITDPGANVTSQEAIRTREKVWKEMLEVLHKVDREVARM
ncbi:uncharacterized protein Z518_06741 [Rhinocladiella mackenziei CBS 650.93]|uniref:Short-chain dehydrogenase/reductase family protein n=1 Tax=Rhinocladiella mackenziei CBS 650.93 TaxID=1442369 RepID=A0A0D2IBJ3_9EURO|nr:uncharacterized protein Z518_06741 [Rhinocladiella mackenziei CBS 650.93]KIX03189.1 hypothetical protein Z518_06741 [Rhinocladiella mackenziei CBS 650.93]